MEYKHCPNCSKKLDGLMSSRYIIKQSGTDLINSFIGSNAEAYCNGCAEPIIAEHKSKNAQRILELNKALGKEISIIPIVTTHTPLNWNYQILEMVSAQSISGTGFLTELSSSWSDFTGGQSSSMANKISSGEELCKTKLRFQCAQLGGNAIIATDIDYSEVGGAKGMLMVCMAGTAVKLDLKDIEEERKNRIELLLVNASELNKLQKIRYPEF